MFVNDSLRYRWLWQLNCKLHLPITSPGDVRWLSEHLRLWLAQFLLFLYRTLFITRHLTHCTLVLQLHVPTNATGAAAETREPEVDRGWQEGHMTPQARQNVLFPPYITAQNIAVFTT